MGTCSTSGGMCTSNLFDGHWDQKSSVAVCSFWTNRYFYWAPRSNALNAAHSSTFLGAMPCPTSSIGETLPST